MSSTTEFDEYAEQYDKLVRSPLRDRFSTESSFFAERKWHLLKRFLIRQDTAPRSLDWLDVGCGTGTLLRIAGGEFRSAAGCDPSSEMLQPCQDLEVTVQNEGTQLPFESNRFDIATLVCVLHHVTPNDRLTLMEDVVRVVRPGGLICIFEHNPLNPVTRLIVSQTPVDRDAVLLTSTESRRLLTNAGCSLSHLEYFLYLPQEIYRRVGGLERIGARIPLGGQYAAFGKNDVD